MYDHHLQAYKKFPMKFFHQNSVLLSAFCGIARKKNWTVDCSKTFKASKEPDTNSVTIKATKQLLTLNSPATFLSPGKDFKLQADGWQVQNG